MRGSFIILSAGLMLSACAAKDAGEKPAQVAAPEVLLQVGDSILTREAVLARLPAGISSADSVRLFDAIVEEWMERNMLVDVAVKNLPDIERIERMVEQYRRQLLAAEYRRLMVEQYSGSVAEDSVKAVYERNPEAYRLDSPIIKGIYVKLPSKAPQMAEVRQWVRSGTPEAIDELEAYGLHGAMEYDYFADQWVAWDEISGRIPHRFEELSKVVAQGSYFETTVNGISYLLHITESKNAGEPMPFDFARPRIEQTLLEQRRRDYDNRMLKDIYKRELRAGRVRAGTYVPMRYRDIKK